MDKSSEAQQNQAPPPGYYSGYPADPKQGGAPPQYYPQQGAHGDPNVYLQQPGQSHIVYVANVPQGPPPPNYMAYAIFVTFCCCWPIGAFAIIRAMDSQKAYTMGDMQRAKELGERSKTMSHWALGVGIAVMVLVFVGVGLYLGLYVLPMINHDWD